MWLDRVTHTQNSNTWGKKIYFQFFYSPSILYRLIKCPFPEKLASQNSLQNKDSGKTIKCRSNRRRKAKGKKRAGQKDRYSFVRDVKILASMKASKKPLNQCTSNLAVLCCKSLLVHPFPYHANWLACIFRQAKTSPKPLMDVFFNFPKKKSRGGLNFED